jgi:hypothetical protein
MEQPLHADIRQMAYYTHAGVSVFRGLLCHAGLEPRGGSGVGAVIEREAFIEHRVDFFRDVVQFC